MDSEKNLGPASWASQKIPKQAKNSHGSNSVPPTLAPFLRSLEPPQHHFTLPGAKYYHSGLFQILTLNMSQTKKHFIL